MSVKWVKGQLIAVGFHNCMYTQKQARSHPHTHQQEDKRMCELLHERTHLKSHKKDQIET